MGFKRCPGSSAFAQPRIEIVKCPTCDGDAEVWSDEPSGTCGACGRSVTRTSTQSCLDWCKYAQECLGDEKYKQYQSLKASMRKQALVAAATDHFDWRKRQVDAAWQVLERTEPLLRAQPGSDPNAILAAVVIGFGCKEASPALTPEVARAAVREVLAPLDYPPGFVENVSALVAPADPDAANNPDAAMIREALGVSEG